VIRTGVVIALAATGVAHADVDWAKGLVTATGIGIADRHAPTPATAREPARRAAEDAARKQLATELAKLPLAAGGTIGAKLDKPHKAQLAAAVADAITVDSTPHTDGSWTVTLGVPIEAVRQVIAGRRTPAAADADPPVVIVEGVTARPAVGYTVGGVPGATVWVKTIPAWAKDAPKVSATKAGGGAITVTVPRGGPSTLFVVVSP